jgi:pimeloyl-ACP methyl ester carboxylesterase
MRQQNTKMISAEKPPIIILGGFLSMAAVYRKLRHALSVFSEQKVWVVNTRPFDWLSSISKVGWFLVLNKLDITVKKALPNSMMSKATLIGHSQGGVLARLYLRPEPFMGKRFNGLDHIDHLITLGSPHLNKGGLQRGGYMARWIEHQVPGSTYSSQVQYTSVAGKFIRGNSTGSPFERFAFKVYKEICGEGETWGDGITPISSALLPGSQHLTLNGVSHYSLLGEPWYGSEEVLPLWWSKIAPK